MSGRKNKNLGGREVASDSYFDSYDASRAETLDLDKSQNDQGKNIAHALFGEKTHLSDNPFLDRMGQLLFVNSNLETKTRLGRRGFFATIPDMSQPYNDNPMLLDFISMLEQHGVTHDQSLAYSQELAPILDAIANQEDISRFLTIDSVTEPSRPCLKSAVKQPLLEKDAIYATVIGTPIDTTAMDVISPITAFDKPGPLKTRHRTKSTELDAQVQDIEAVRAARRLVRTFERRKGVALDSTAKEQVRQAQRLVTAYNARRRAREAPALS
jgi:hypothetical protein